MTTETNPRFQCARNCVRELLSETYLLYESLSSDLKKYHFKWIRFQIFFFLRKRTMLKLQNSAIGSKFGFHLIANLFRKLIKIGSKNQNFGGTMFPEGDGSTSRHRNVLHTTKHAPLETERQAVGMPKHEHLALVTVRNTHFGTGPVPAYATIWSG